MRTEPYYHDGPSHIDYWTCERCTKLRYVFPDHQNPYCVCGITGTFIEDLIMPSDCPLTESEL